MIGVDGGADALLELGYVPHLIIGDMDSVSDEVLHSSAFLVVHAYKNGMAPGLGRIKEQNLEATLFPAPGPAKMRLYCWPMKEGLSIVAVGLHSNLIDFLEKGRSGMASTLW